MNKNHRKCRVLKALRVVVAGMNDFMFNFLLLHLNETRR